MLGQILPGFRELRGPLAAGFTWILLGYLIVHQHVSTAHGKVKEIVELGEHLSPAALAVAASFVAYLLGSLSEDLFRRALAARFDREITYPEAHPEADVDPFSQIGVLRIIAARVDGG